MQNPNLRMGNAEWKRRDKQIKEEMRNEADEDWQRIERERKRSEREQRYRETTKGRETQRNFERMETMRDESDEDRQRIERERQSGNKPSGSGGTLAQACAWKLEMCMCTLDQECAHCTTNLPRLRHDFRCRICRCILPHPPRSTCPRVACHGSLDIDVEAADKVIAADMALSRNSKMELEAEHGKGRMETQRPTKRKRCATKPTRIGNTSSGSGNAETEKE